MIKQFDDIDPALSDKFHFTGELRLKNVIKEMNYFLHNNSLNENKSITDFLMKVYKSDTPQIKISIRNLDNNHIIEREGELFKDRDRFGVYDWYVGVYPLGYELFELADVNARLEVEMKHLISAEISEAVEQDGQS